MDGKEQFEFDGRPLGFNLMDFWRFQYSGIYNLYGSIAEFIVAQALDISQSQNSEYWALWDITYRNTKIEVKATAYYHLWNIPDQVSKQRVFGIGKASGIYDPKVAGNTEYRRQNDIYVFCLNNGRNKETAYPLNLNNWLFYIVPTSCINQQCNNQKTISLGRIRHLGFKAWRYDEIRKEIDRIIDEREKHYEL